MDQANLPSTPKKKTWLGSLFHSEDPTADVKLLCLFLVIVSGIVWLSYDLKNGIDNEWNSAFETLAILAGGAVVGGGAVEAWRRFRGGKLAQAPVKGPEATEGNKP